MKQFTFLNFRAFIFAITIILSFSANAQRPIFQQVEPPEEIRSINALIAEKENQVWIASAQGLYNYSNNQFTRFYEEEKSQLYKINALAIDPKGQMWFGTYNGVLVKFHNNLIVKSYDIKPYSTNDNRLITSISIDKTNNENQEVLLTTSGGEIFAVNPKTNTIRKIERPSIDKIVTIYSILHGFNSTIWLCTSNGFYTMKNNSRWKKKPGLYTAYNLTENEGKFWAIGRDEQKRALLMLYFNQDNNPKKRFVWKNFDLSLLKDIFTRFYEVTFSKGEIAWIASQSGLVRYNPVSGSVKVYEKDKNINIKSLRHVAAYNNQVWASSSGKRLIKAVLK